MANKQQIFSPTNITIDKLLAGTGNDTIKEITIGSGLNLTANTLTSIGAPIDIDNLPVGSVINPNLNKAVLDTPAKKEYWNKIYNNYILQVSGNSIISSDISPLMFLQSVAFKNRNALSYNGTNWYNYRMVSNFAEVSETGSSFSNIEICKYNFNISINANVNENNYYCDFANSKVIIGLLNNCNSYLYSENMTSYTKVDTNLTLRRPVVSGSTYSFWNSINSVRVYTTNHTTFTNVTGFASSDLQIHKLNNGNLYATSGTTLYLSTNNGQSFTTYTLPASTNSSNNHCLDFDGTTYVYGTTSNGLWSSTDLTTWTSRTSNITGTPILHRVYFVNSLWFVFSETSATTSFSTSANGTTWTNRTWGTGSQVGNYVVFTNSLYMILCYSSVNTSPTGATWTQSLGAGNSDIDVDYRVFYGTGTKASFINSNTWYFYNADVWTTITNSQGSSGMNSIANNNFTNGLIKVR